MSEMKLCKWCGAAQSGEEGDDVLFECGSWHSGSTPEFQWSQCKLNVAERRIRRSLEVLQIAQQYSPQAYSRMEKRKLGGWFDADDVNRAIQILQEGGSSE